MIFVEMDPGYFPAWMLGVTHGDHAIVSLRNLWECSSTEDTFISLFAQTVSHEWLHMLVMWEGYPDAYEATIKSVASIESVVVCQRCGGPSDEIYMYEYAPGQAAGPLCEDCSRKIEFLYSVLDG